MAFIERLLSAKFTLGQGTFGNTAPPDSNAVTVSGLRMRAEIARAGGAAQATLNLTVYGMDLSVMNSLSTLGFVATTARKNSVLVQAGDSNGMTTVFQGTIQSGYVDLGNMPDVSFKVNASAAFYDSLAPAKPSSYPKPTDVATILQDIAGQLNVPFEGNGVSVILPPSYFSGSLIQQAQAAVDHAGISWNKLEDNTLAIWTPGMVRGGEAPLVSKDTGLVQYPRYTSNGIAFRTVFNPAIGFGKPVNVESGQLLQNQTDSTGNVTKVSGNGTWGVTSLNHTLETKVPHGAWFSEIEAAPVGYIVAPG